MMDKRLQSIGLGKLINDKDEDLLKTLLKQLLNEKSNIATKLDIIIFIEEEIQSLVSEEDCQSIKLVATAFRSLLKAPASEANANLLGQSLMSSTSLLLTSLDRMGHEEVGQMLLGHVEVLLALVCQANNTKNVHLRAVAACCMMEVELCFPGILKECLDVIYTATAFETSTAHQQYLELLTVLMSHSQQDLTLDSSIPQFHVPPALSRGCIPTVARLPASELQQLAAFALDQLPLLSTAACVRVASRAAGTLQALSDSPLTLAGTKLLQPVLQQYLTSHCLSACQLVIQLESQFGPSEHLIDDYQQSLLDHLAHGATLPSLPVASRLIFLSWLYEFLAHHPDLTSQLSCQQLLEPRPSDGTHTQLKKIQLMTLLHKGDEGSTHSDIVTSLDHICQQIYSKPESMKLKAAFIKILYFILTNMNTNFTIKTYIQRILVEVTVRDNSFSPFLLDLVRALGDAELEGVVLGAVLSRLVHERSKSHSLQHLTSTLDIMLHAVSALDIGIAQPKDMLTYMAKCLEAGNVKVNASTGHHVLSLCHKIMKLFDAREFLSEMEQVLKFLVSHCCEDDVQNRAQSYITLLACLSDIKVKEVLKAQKKTMSQLMVTEGMFHKTDSLQVLEQPVIRLDIQSKLLHLERTSSDLETLPHLPENALDLYKQHIENEVNTKTIIIPCTVSFVRPVLENVQAVAVFLSLSNPVGKIDPIFVGNMSQKLAMRGNEDSVETKVYYVPKMPYPVVANARSEFSMDGKFYSAPLEIFKIDLENLFQPLPVPEDFLDSAKQWRKGIFTLLWDSMEHQNNTEVTAVINLPISQVRSKIKHDLKHFVIQKGAREADLGIFIAPSEHVLIKMHHDDESSTLRILTPDIYLLAHVNDYFSHW